MKKFSFLAALVLPLFIATAASAGPVVSSPTLGSGEAIGIAITSTNKVLASNWTTNTLYSVDFNTAVPTVTSVGTPSLHGPEGILLVPGTTNQYFVSNQQGTAISIVSVVNGMSTPVTTFGNQSSVSGLAVLNGILYAQSQGGGLSEYSLVNGTWTRINSIATSSSGAGGMSVTASGNIVVGASTGGLNIYSPTGTLLSSFGSSMGNVAGVAVDGAGNIFASSFNTGTVNEYAQNGTLINTFQVPVGTEAWQIAIDVYGNVFVTTRYTGTVVKFGNAGAAFIQNTTPDAPTGLAAATVSHTTMKLSWSYQTSPTTQFICTASNGATATVTGTSCSLNGFDLYNPGSYSFSVTAVVDGVQSDAAVLSVSVKS